MFKPRVPLEEDDFYLNEKGYKVFTEKFHLKRGYCCKSGCKHCPYGYDKKTDSFK
jgi:hypothetical protein